MREREREENQTKLLQVFQFPFLQGKNKFLADYWPHKLFKISQVCSVKIMQAQAHHSSYLKYIPRWNHILQNLVMPSVHQKMGNSVLHRQYNHDPLVLNYRWSKKQTTDDKVKWRAVFLLSEERIYYLTVLLH